MTVRSLLAHDFVGGGAIPRCILTDDVTGSAGMGRSRIDYRWYTRGFNSLAARSPGSKPGIHRARSRRRLKLSGSVMRARSANQMIVMTSRVRVVELPGAPCGIHP